MTPFTRSILVRGALVASGAAAGAGSTIAMSAGAHESITLAIGDSVTPKFFIRTDTVLAAVGNSTLIARACGSSFIYLRNYRRGVQLSADTVAVTVTCPHVVVLPPVSTLDTVLTVCPHPDPDSVRKYRPILPEGGTDTTVSPLLIPCLVPELAGDSMPRGAQRGFVSYSRTRPKPSVPIAMVLR